jgi:uncharacterized membrane protein YgdD (TMEM256/DUF423 family)
VLRLSLGFFMSTAAQCWIAAGALLAAAGVALGAASAHWLEGLLTGLGYGGDDLAHRLAIFDTAVRYQMLHAVALVVVGLALQGRSPTAWQVAAWALLVGVVVFCGLLYVLALASPAWRWLGAVVPLGGVAFIFGWLALAFGALAGRQG